MALRLQVTCINKREHYNPHERIVFIGGAWGKHSQRDAILNIQHGSINYFVSFGGYTTDVEVAYHNGNPYLKTKPDATGKDNLLNLSECG